MSVAVSAALALNLLLWSGACCASVLCKMQQLGEPSDKGNPYGALHNSHMQNDTGGFSLFLDVGCFLFSCCCRLMLCLFKWILQFTIFFSQSLKRAVCIFCLIFKYLYTHPIWHIFLNTQTPATAIQALKLLESFQGIFVLSIVGRPELCQSVFQARKNKV